MPRSRGGEKGLPVRENPVLMLRSSSARMILQLRPVRRAQLSRGFPRSVPAPAERGANRRWDELRPTHDPDIGSYVTPDFG